MSLDNLKTTLNAIKYLLTDYPKKKDIPASLTDDDILECLIDTDMLSAVADNGGAILTDENSKILLM